MATAPAQREAAVTVNEATAATDLEETKRLAAEFESLGGSALTMAPQEAEPGDPLRECWLGREWLRVWEARSINRAESLTARTYASAEAAEAAAAEAAAAEAATADAPGARAALAPELPKEPGGGAGGMAEDAD
jgi:hypothetical protein